MQSDLGKLFIGGISWDTNEEKLKEYFSSYGEIVETIIMKDRNTGRARGFGFVVFSDPAAADRVVKEKHNIDGRLVEAKKAVPRDDQNTLIRANNSTQGSPSPGRTRKIFVGGLASSVTENDFKQYFEQFGTITDVVVMYDHNTQRPRGFGFITFDSEEAVDNVLLKTFHELNDKTVEVKRAVPKEMSPGPSRSPLGGYNHGLNRVNSFLDDYIQRYAPNTIGSYGVRMDGRLNSIGGGRIGFPPFVSAYEMGMNYEPGLSGNYRGSENFNGNLNYGRGMNPYYIGNSNRIGSPSGYAGGNGGNTSFFSSGIHDLWGDGGLNNYGTNSMNSGSFVGSGSANIGGGTFSNNGVNWGSSPISAPRGGYNISTPSGNLGYGGGDNNVDLGMGRYGRNIGNNTVPTSLNAPSNDRHDGPFGDFYGSGTVYSDPTWRSENNDRGGMGTLGFGLGNVASDASAGSSPSYVSGYGANKRQANRGIAT